MHDAEVQQQIIRDKDFSFADLEILTNLCFQTNQYLKNFPQVFQEENREHLFLLRLKNKIASFCSIYPFSFHVNGTRLSAYCIGSVCTHPKYRNLGLAQKAVTMAEMKAIENAADFIFLFADKNKLYANLNFIPTGKTFLAQIGTNISNQIALNNCKSIMEQLEKFKSIFDNNPIQILFKKNLLELTDFEKTRIWQFIILNRPPCESVLSYLDFCNILAIKNMNIFYATNNNQIFSLCFYNKGDDFQNVIHSSYYTNRNYLFILIKEILSINKGKDIIFFPGALSHEFEDVFDFISIPSMSIKTLNEKKIPIQILQNFCIKNLIFVNSLQGT
ncbi:GNAT family N-acetyltransferase [Silvanigrella aquatica]|uniref:N-acetyltransferase domain-containing protein n=1 Tax=Silvanigrella aquatica TaxID=1915309 RepID=A0A1L4D3W2_9BACT|nr:GNAT family N-acetyltransferase [Silvanigrella aquatica]APJ04904.1 hypothetical protein AXG55_13780 [Silvanigrella aquatica]